MCFFLEVCDACRLPGTVSKHINLMILERSMTSDVQEESLEVVLCQGEIKLNSVVGKNVAIKLKIKKGFVFLWGFFQ